jgi:hypothetical protein
MSECDPIELRRGTIAVMPARSGDPASPNPSGQNIPSPGAANPGSPGVVAFDRHELREIMNLYGRKVAAGEWRDYALDFTPHHAVFSIFRRSSEVPLYRIEKDPKLGRRQGAYRVVVAGGQILKRGHDLAHVIGVLDCRLKIVT